MVIRMKATTIKGILKEVGETSIMIKDDEYPVTERTKDFVNKRMIGKEVEARIENGKVTFIRVIKNG